MGPGETLCLEPREQVRGPDKEGLTKRYTKATWTNLRTLGEPLRITGDAIDRLPSQKAQLWLPWVIRVGQNKWARRWKREVKEEPQGWQEEGIVKAPTAHGMG